MEKTGAIEIRITGSKGNLDLAPDNYDIREIIAILENAEDLLYPGEKRDRPVISYKIEEGSVRHILKTSIQYIIGFNAIMGQINQSRNIDFLELPTARALENIQEIAAKRNYVFSIKTSLENTNEMRLDRATRLIRTEAVWADAEFYFYGKITSAGGKGKTNIHVLTDEVGTVIVQTPVSFFENLTENIIYKKNYGIRATGKQHSVTGEIDTTTLQFVELVDFQPAYDETYLNELRSRAKKSWLGKIDPDQWLREIRGAYDA